MASIIQGVIGIIILLVVILIIVNKIKKAVKSVKNFLTGSRGDGRSIGWEKIAKNMKYDLFKGKGYILYRGLCGYYNSVASKIYEQDYDLRSCYIDDEYYFFTKYRTEDSWIRLDKQSVSILQYTISKYLEWEDKATIDGVKIQKDIPDATFITDVAWRSGQRISLGSDLIVSFSFFSQSEKRHQLVLDTNKVNAEASSGSGYETFQMQLYFDKDQVIELQKALSDENLNSEKLKIQEDFQKIEKSKNAEATFN